MSFDEACESIIKQFGLVKNKRMAVLYMVCLGDFYSLCSTAEQAARAANIEIILLCFSDLSSEVLNLFEYDDCVVETNRISEDVYNVIKNGGIDEKKRFTDFFIFWDCGHDEFRNLTHNASDKFFHPVKRPVFPYVNISEKYSEYINPQKTVLIIPEANTIQPFPLWFWNFSAWIFETMGLSVVFNVPLHRAKLYRGKSIFVPIIETVPFANECGYVYGVRSGLFDLLSSSTAKMVLFSTKAYLPIDRVFGIEDSSGRIRTVFYENTDYFFEKTAPISYVKKAFEDSVLPIKKLLYELCKEQAEPLDEIYTPEVLNAYKHLSWRNGYLAFPNKYLIDPFIDAKYSYRIANEKIIFSIANLTSEKYRYDYKIFFNDKCVADYQDMHSNYLVYPLEYSGEYYITATLTDLNSCNRECFETHRLIYAAPLPNSRDALALCCDFCSYVSALKFFSKDMIIFICSRDSHTYFSKTKDTAVLNSLKILGIYADIEGTPRYSYIGIVDNSLTVYEELSKDQTIVHHYVSDDCDALIESSGYNATHTDKTSIKIEINGENMAVDSRGINFVVWDKKTKAVIDTVAFDTFDGNRALRRNFPVSQTRSGIKHGSGKIVFQNYTARFDEIKEIAASLAEKNGRLEKEVIELKEMLVKSKQLYEQVNDLSSKNIDLIELNGKLKIQQQELMSDLKKTQSEIAALNLTAEKSAQDIQTAYFTISELENRIDIYEKSRSWRLTKPLRSIAGFFRRWFGKNVNKS